MPVAPATSRSFRSSTTPCRAGDRATGLTLRCRSQALRGAIDSPCLLSTGAVPPPRPARPLPGRRASSRPCSVPRGRSCPQLEAAATIRERREGRVGAQEADAQEHPDVRRHEALGREGGQQAKQKSRSRSPVACRRGSRHSTAPLPTHRSGSAPLLPPLIPRPPVPGVSRVGPYPFHRVPLLSFTLDREASGRASKALRRCVCGLVRAFASFHGERNGPGGGDGAHLGQAVRPV